MTTIVRLTRAELRKLATPWTFPITLALSAGLAVINVIVTAATAGQHGRPALGSTASTGQMLNLGAIICMAMLGLGIIASGGEYRHKTIIPAVLVAPRRSALVAAKVIGISVAGAMLSVLTFGLGLGAAAAQLAAHHLHPFPADTGRLLAGSVIAGTLFGVIGVALGYITRSTTAAVLGAIGWVFFAEMAILHTAAPHLAKWLVTGAAVALTSGAAPGGGTLNPYAATGVLTAYAIALLAVAARLVLRRDVP
jgi:hypothetical protein